MFVLPAGDAALLAGRTAGLERAILTINTASNAGTSGLALRGYSGRSGKPSLRSRAIAGLYSAGLPVPDRRSTFSTQLASLLSDNHRGQPRKAWYSLCSRPLAEFRLRLLCEI